MKRQMTVRTILYASLVVAIGAAGILLTGCTVAPTTQTLILKTSGHPGSSRRRRLRRSPATPTGGSCQEDDRTGPRVRRLQSHAYAGSLRTPAVRRLVCDERQFRVCERILSGTGRPGK